MPSNREEFALLPWLCMSETLPGSWWHRRRQWGLPLCVFPPTTPRARAWTGWGFHPTSRPSILWPDWLWSQHAAALAAHSSIWRMNTFIFISKITHFFHFFYFCHYPSLKVTATSMVHSLVLPPFLLKALSTVARKKKNHIFLLKRPPPGGGLESTRVVTSCHLGNLLPTLICTNAFEN